MLAMGVPWASCIWLSASATESRDGLSTNHLSQRRDFLGLSFNDTHIAALSSHQDVRPRLWRFLASRSLLPKLIESVTSSTYSTTTPILFLCVFIHYIVFCPIINPCSECLLDYFPFVYQPLCIFYRHHGKRRLSFFI